MKYILTILIGAAVLFMVSCGGGNNVEQRSGEDTTGATENTADNVAQAQENPAAVPSNPVPTSVSHEPYTVEDEDDFIELDGGVKLYFIKKGDGVTPSGINQKIKAHYHGMLEDGKVFDSSFDRGVPLEFPLGRVIKGWQAGLMNAPVGSKIKLIIPSTMGYGATPRPGIPANSTLIFDVEVLDVMN